MIYKIVRLLVNALTPDDQHYLLNRDNLTQPIQMQLSQKQKTFCQFFFFFFFFFAFSKSRLNFGPFPKKNDPYSGCISEIKGSEKRG